MNATLLGNRVSVADVSMVPDVPFTRTFHPVHHRDVIRVVKDSIENLGMCIMKAEHVLAQNGMALNDIDLVELNEAFAAQALAVMRQLGMDQERTNVNGGAIALGHPLGCTGAKLTVQLMNEMKRRDVNLGMVTMCVGGGQGAAGIFEQLN